MVTATAATVGTVVGGTLGTVTAGAGAAAAAVGLGDLAGRHKRVGNVLTAAGGLSPYVVGGVVAAATGGVASIPVIMAAAACAALGEKLDVWQAFAGIIHGENLLSEEDGKKKWAEWIEYQATGGAKYDDEYAKKVKSSYTL